ncbi:hypothetical protein HMPREF9126_1411 [Parvimonas sp. oral taxon 110 str. F0139]|nr:hypothetical protein HMPREF9126_1411 [Parvimonas sp. oral taxon 110 str. F0139]
MDDKRDNIFDENENNIKNEEHKEETSRQNENNLNETQKLFNEENINNTIDEDYGEYTEDPYDYYKQQEIYDEPYMEDSNTQDKKFESYVDGIVQKEFEKRKKLIDLNLFQNSY